MYINVILRMYKIEYYFMYIFYILFNTHSKYNFRAFVIYLYSDIFYILYYIIYHHFILSSQIRLILGL